MFGGITRTVQLKPRNQNYSETLEELFMKLLKKPEYANTKPLVGKLKELLINSFPEEITEKWFENVQDEEKKK